MPDAVRYALIFGIVAGVLYLAILLWRHKGLKGSHIPEAITLVFVPFPIPGALEMIYKAFGKNPLPIFNDAESRAALILGGMMLIATFIYSLYVAGKHALKSKPNLGTPEPS